MRHLASQTVSLLLLFSLGAPLAAQSFVPRPFPTEGISSFTFDSPSMGVKYDVSVWVPPSYKRESGKRLPLLVVTDGNLSFTVTLDAVRSLLNQRVIPEMMIASIGAPPEAGELAFVSRRVYEFSPPDWPMNDTFGKVVKEGCGKTGSAPGRCVGGAPRFLKVINDELIAGLARQFPVDTTKLGLFGISAGGFFASFVMFQPESRFTKYIIASPAMAYGDGEIFRQETRFAATHKDLNAGIYFAAGSLEMNDEFLEGVGQIVSGMTHLAGVLTSRNYKSLRMQTDIQPGMGHGDAAGTTLVRGLRFLYGVTQSSGGNYH